MHSAERKECINENFDILVIFLVLNCMKVLYKSREVLKDKGSIQFKFLKPTMNLDGIPKRLEL